MDTSVHPLNTKCKRNANKKNLVKNRIDMNRLFDADTKKQPPALCRWLPFSLLYLHQRVMDP